MTVAFWRDSVGDSKGVVGVEGRIWENKRFCKPAIYGHRVYIAVRGLLTLLSGIAVHEHFPPRKGVARPQWGSGSLWGIA